MTDNPNLLQANGERLWGSIEASAGIGAGPRGGLKRLALGDDDGAMRALFVRWCEEAGLSVAVDRVGNIFARRAGRLAVSALRRQFKQPPRPGAMDRRPC